jgi:hypothetical protein
VEPVIHRACFGLDKRIPPIQYSFHIRRLPVATVFTFNAVAENRAEGTRDGVVVAMSQSSQSSQQSQSGCLWAGLDKEGVV